METQSPLLPDARESHRKSRHRHDRPVNAVVIWTGFAILYCALQHITGNRVSLSDLQGLVLAGAVVYAVAALMDVIAKKLGPPFAP